MIVFICLQILALVIMGGECQSCHLHCCMLLDLWKYLLWLPGRSTSLAPLNCKHTTSTLTNASSAGCVNLTVTVCCSVFDSSSHTERGKASTQFSEEFFLSREEAITGTRPLSKSKSKLALAQSDSLPSHMSVTSDAAVDIELGPADPQAGSLQAAVHRANVVAAGGAAPAGPSMGLPFKPMSLTFKDICYCVDMPHHMDGFAEASKVQNTHTPQLQLLHSITGSFRPGVLTALMGVSGAGKTTLMDVLAGRKTTGTITGDMRVNGWPKVQATFARINGYVEQSDIHSPRTTVLEALQFSAQLRLHGHGKKTALAFAQEVMQLVELSSLRDALVGIPGKSGLSTEQRKRLTIAVELVANPSIVFMDEPTSGAMLQPTCSA